jgi:hypothetical protein
MQKGSGQRQRMFEIRTHLRYKNERSTQGFITDIIIFSQERTITGGT